VFFDRPTGSTGLGAEPAPAPGLGGAAASGDASPAMRLQILSTEHWSLLASRSLAWNEVFSRAGMFLSTLSGAIVALALVAQATAFGENFTLFALVILPVVLFIGVTTLIRLRASNYHDAMCVIGMNRIRAAYLELAPDLERYFVMSGHDDLHGVRISMGLPPGGGPMPLAYLLAATPIVIAVVDSVLAGLIAAVAALRFGAANSTAMILGLFGFFLAMVAQIWWSRATIAKDQAGYRPLFPS
jgi:hypothetical protein